MGRGAYGAAEGVAALLAAVAEVAAKGKGPCSLCEQEVPLSELLPPLRTLPAFRLCNLCRPLVCPPPPDRPPR